MWGVNWDRAAQLGVSLVWMACATGLLVGGVARRHQPTRLVALLLTGLTVLKVFLFDLTFLAPPYRILSLGGLGVSLLGISWLYSRFGSEPGAQPG
jgi:uncharacterized membrane protein